MGQQNFRFHDLARQLLGDERGDEGGHERGHGRGHERGRQDTAADLVAAMEGAFRRLHEHTCKLIGRAGFQALVARAAHLTSAEAGWIESITFRAEPVLTLEGLSERIESEGAGPVFDGLALLLANLIGLLCTFIGESLTLLLVRRIWPEVAPEFPGSGSKEGK